MRRLWLALSLFALTLTPALALPAAAQYQVIATDTVLPAGDLVRTDTTVEVDGEVVNRFRMHRLRKAHQTPRGAVLLLPPLGNPFSFFETDEHGVYDRSFAAFLAHAGWEVWGYTPRGYALTSGDCEGGAVDCSPMGGWGLSAAVADATWIRGHMVAALPGVEPVVGGYSLGAIHTIALLDAHPGDWRAGMIIEGGLFTEDPVVRASNANWCGFFEGLLAGGFVFDGQTSPTIRLIAQLATVDPDGPTPLPGFPPGTTNHQVLVFLLAAPADNPTSPTPDFVRCVGSVADDSFDYCDEDRLFAHLPLFLDYVDNRTFRDINCSLAGETTFTDGLGAFGGSVLLIGGGFGFGELDGELEALFSSADVSRSFLPAYGHGDVWFVISHRAVLESDVLSWLNTLP